MNPVYSIEIYGIQFKASSRHADALALPGPFTRNLEQAAGQTFEAMPEPKRVILVGNCAINGGIFKNSYAIKPLPLKIKQAVKLEIPGCPPSPREILKKLVAFDSKP